MFGIMEILKSSEKRHVGKSLEEIDEQNKLFDEKWDALSRQLTDELDFFNIVECSKLPLDLQKHLQSNFETSNEACLKQMKHLFRHRWIQNSIDVQVYLYVYNTLMSQLESQLKSGMINGVITLMSRNGGISRYDLCDKSTNAEWSETAVVERWLDIQANEVYKTILPYLQAELRANGFVFRQVLSGDYFGEQMFDRLLLVYTKQTNVSNKQI